MPTPPETVPPIEATIETVVYAADLAAAEAFYTRVLGLPVIVSDHSRHVFFRVGTAAVFLVFKPDATIKGGEFPPHG